MTMSQANAAFERGYENQPLPFGWFAVAYSDEIAVGEVKTLKYFATQFVVWRGEDGVLHGADAHCPHMGAHLGVGGKVVGNDIQCPFHHWQFSPSGGVTEIPYAKGIPLALQEKCLPVWPIQESLGVVYAWYHPRKAAPKWELATADEITNEGWIEAERHEWIIKIHLQEITENGQDYAHFRAVHGTQGPPESEFTMDGWIRRTVVETQMVTPRGPMLGKIDNYAVGPGQSISRFTDVTQVTMMQEVTAIDSATTHVRWQLYHPPGLSDGKMRVTVARMRDLSKQINQDIPIWENKVYMPQPLVIRDDGPVMAYRRAYQRFYDFDTPSEPAIAAE
jgi:3-ketosteroid 9alpha-monooxygenase subunit A